MNLHEMLNDLKIDILPPIKLVAKPYMVEDFFCADIFEFTGFEFLPVMIFICATEQELKTRLHYHKCEYLMQRNFVNFKNWYESINGCKLTYPEIQKTSKKFNY